MSRRIAVEANDERNAHLSGRPVKVSIQTTQFQGSVITLTRAEAEHLRDALTAHLNPTREDKTND